jgi:hypothetical protein
VADASIVIPFTNEHSQLRDYRVHVSTLSDRVPFTAPRWSMWTLVFAYLVGLACGAIR